MRLPPRRRTWTPAIVASVAPPGKPAQSIVTRSPPAASRPKISKRWISAPPARGLSRSRSFRTRTWRATGIRRSQPPEEVRGPEIPGDPQGLQADPLRHLRVADRAVHEDDGDLLDSQTTPPGAVGHLDLEGVAVGAHSSDVHRLERAPAPALEAARGVAHREPGHAPDVPVAEVAEQQALDRPVDDGDPLQVPRPEDEIAAGDALEEARDHLRRVREVRVHLD